MKSHYITIQSPFSLEKTSKNTMFARKIAMKSPFSLDTSSTITIFPGKITIFPCKHHDFPHFSYVKSPFFPRCSAVDAGHPVTGHRGHLRAVPTTFRMANEDHQLLGRKILMGLWVFGDSHLRGCTGMFHHCLYWKSPNSMEISLVFTQFGDWFTIWAHPQILAVWYTQ